MTRPKLEDFKIENGGKFGYTVAMEKYTDYLERKTKAKPPTKTTTMNPNLKEAIQNNIRSVMFNENRIISSIAFGERLESRKPKEGDWGHIVNYRVGRINYDNFLSSLLELGQFVECDEEGKPISRPEHYDDWCKYGDFTKHGKSITPLCREYSEAQKRIILQGCVYDEEMKTVRNGIGNDLFYNWDHKRLSTVETLVSRNVDLTDSKALELGLKTKAKEVAKEGFTDLKNK